MKEIVLASASPRRSELLKQLNIEFHVSPSELEEVLDESLRPEELVQKLSFQKASDVAEKMRKQNKTGCLVIGADTVVVKDKVLGKPADTLQAYKMLESLQGAWHEVITGVALVDVENGKTVSFFEKTRVKMRELNSREIDSYIKTGEPIDKAGAYGIQGMGAVLVERIEGCYFNVVGLPLTKLAVMLREFGAEVL